MAEESAHSSDGIDHDENCAACGVYERERGSRLCEGCRDALVTDGGIERCDVFGCGNPAIAQILPTHGQTDHTALRCKDCLLYDLDRDWFEDWKGAIGRRDDYTLNSETEQ